MPHFSKLTPNLLVADVERSIRFYTDVLGFTRGMTVPEAAPFAFAQVTSGPVEIFLNESQEAAREYPMLGDRPIGLTGTLFIEVEGIHELHDRLRAQMPIASPFVTQWYGMMEFAIADPDGYIITFAQRAPSTT